MFTGLVEKVGQCALLERNEVGAWLAIDAGEIASDARIGDSVAVNGCCLTVTSIRESVLSFDVLEESLKRTNLGALGEGSAVNLERAMAADGRLGGHFVQGHVDSTAAVIGTTEKGNDLRLEFELPDEFASYVAFKGSIAINGVSLTVAEVGDSTFAVWIIPHTRAMTNLGGLRAGDRVNLEFDILAKYAERILSRKRD